MGQGITREALARYGACLPWRRDRLDCAEEEDLLRAYRQQLLSELELIELRLGVLRTSRG